MIYGVFTFSQGSLNCTLFFRYLRTRSECYVFLVLNNKTSNLFFSVFFLYLINSNELLRNFKIKTDLSSSSFKLISFFNSVQIFRKLS